MNQRVHNLSKWRSLGEGEALEFPKDKARTVILEVNCPGEVCFYISQPPEKIEHDEERERDIEGGRDPGPPIPDVAFLGVAKGRDRFEFGVNGPFQLLADGGPAYIFTADGLDDAVRVEEPEIFTRVANRKQRNPHLEMIEYMARLNQLRFEESLREEMERRIKAVEQGLETYKPQRDQRAPSERAWPPRQEDDREEMGGSSEADPSPEQSSGEAGKKGRGKKPADDPGGSGEV